MRENTSKDSHKPMGVILAAGSSTRTKPLTDEVPKPLLPILNKPILSYILEALEHHVSNMIIVVGFHHEQIETFIKEHHPVLSSRISFVMQDQQLGTAHALQMVDQKISGDFILANGDNIIFSNDVKKLAQEKNAILAAHSDAPQNFGVIEVDKGMLANIVEKPEKPATDLVNAGVYHLEQDFLTLLKEATMSDRMELELPQILMLFHEAHPVHVVETTEYYPITHPWDMLDTTECLMKEKQSFPQEGTVENGAVFKGNVEVGKGTLIRSGAYIEGPVLIGPDCTIGPNCFIRPHTVIGAHCKVGNAVEIKNSILMSGVCAGHLSYLGDSVVGFDTNLGAGTITANLRHDDLQVRCKVNHHMIPTGRRKLGAIIGSHVHTGIHTSLYPGRKIASGAWTKPGDIVSEDVK